MANNASSYLKSRRVNFFYGVWDSDCSKVTTVEDVLTGIRDGEWKEEVEYYRNEKDKDQKEELKKQFLAVTFSGTFIDKRHDSNLDIYSHILVVDVDLKDMKHQPSTVRKKLEECPFIFAVFESPSGGFKALSFSRISAANHELFFEGVKEYFQQKDVNIDSSGRNPGRLCFVSYDPDLYLSFERKHPFVIEKDSPKLYNKLIKEKHENKQHVDYSRFEESRDMNHIMKMAKKWAGHYHKGNRNNFIFKLSCVLNRAGVDKEVAIHCIKDTYSSLSEKELETTVKSAYKHNSFEFGTRPIYSKKTGQSKLF